MRGVCLFVCLFARMSFVGLSVRPLLSLALSGMGLAVWVPVVVDAIVRCYVVTDVSIDRAAGEGSCDTQKKAGAGGSGEGAAKARHTDTLGLMDGGGRASHELHGMDDGERGRGRGGHSSCRAVGLRAHGLPACLPLRLTHTLTHSVPE